MDIAMLEEVPPRESLDSFTLSRHTNPLFRRTTAHVLGVEPESLCHKSHWVPKSMRAGCSNCKRSFRVYNTKHNCRLCGEVVCGPCSTQRILFQKKSVRACDECVDSSMLAMAPPQRTSNSSSNGSTAATTPQPQLQLTSSHLNNMLPIPSLSRSSSNSSNSSHTSNSSEASSVGGEVVPFDRSSNSTMVLKKKFAPNSPVKTPTQSSLVKKRKSDSDLVKPPVESFRPRRQTHAITKSEPCDELLSVEHLSPIEAWNVEVPYYVMVLIMVLVAILCLQSIV